VRLFPSRLRFSRRPHDLADAYALDALDDAERERFERHLRGCPACADEVRKYAEVAMRDRVLAATAVTRQLPPEVAASRRRVTALPRSPWVPRLATGFAVAAVAAAVTLGVIEVSTQDRLNTAQAQNQAIAAVLTAPDAMLTSAVSSVGGTATVVLSHSEQKIVFTSSGLPALPSSEVYQLWLIGPVHVRSAGLLSEASDGKTTPVLASGLQADDKVGVTVEPAGGTSSPTTTPILAMTLPD
jgi:hypothetical protein